MALRRPGDGEGAAGDVEWLKIRGGERGAEAEAFCRHAYHRQDGDRVHFDAADTVDDGVGVVASEQIRHREAIVKKAEVEFSCLQRTSDAAVIFG